MDKRLKILLEVYKKVYSELGEDFDKLKEDGTTQQEQWFMEYEMPHKRQEEILEEVFNKYKLNKATRGIISINYWLGCSPKSTRNSEK